MVSIYLNQHLLKTDWKLNSLEAICERYKWSPIMHSMPTTAVKWGEGGWIVTFLTVYLDPEISNDIFKVLKFQTEIFRSTAS